VTHNNPPAAISDPTPAAISDPTPAAIQLFYKSSANLSLIYPTYSSLRRPRTNSKNPSQKGVFAYLYTQIVTVQNYDIHRGTKFRYRILLCAKRHAVQALSFGLRSFPILG
jgi:hypothetical protein